MCVNWRKNINVHKSAIYRGYTVYKLVFDENDKNWFVYSPTKILGFYKPNHGFLWSTFPDSYEFMRKHGYYGDWINQSELR